MRHHHRSLAKDLSHSRSEQPGALPRGVAGLVPRGRTGVRGSAEGQSAGSARRRVVLWRCMMTSTTFLFRSQGRGLAGLGEWCRGPNWPRVRGMCMVVWLGCSVPPGTVRILSVTRSGALPGFPLID